MAKVLDPALWKPFKAPTPADPDQLWNAVYNAWGIKIPFKQCCKHHTPPFQAFCDAFFGWSPVSIWKGSRGYGGKSTLLGTLVLSEAAFLGAQSTVLGGSAAQSQRVHEVTHELWYHPTAPRSLLDGEPTKYVTRLKPYVDPDDPTLNRPAGRIVALMASQKSVRGPHPQRLRLDEIDEMELPILEAAQGQPQAHHGITAQTVMSSTHQYPDGTMTEMLKRANAKGWPVFTWCILVDSQVVTGDGYRAIQDVEPGMEVLTRKGWKRVQHVTRVGVKDTVVVRTADGRTLRCTSDHQVATTVGWVEAGKLTAAHKVITTWVHDGQPDGAEHRLLGLREVGHDDGQVRRLPVWGEQAGVEHVLQGVQQPCPGQAVGRAHEGHVGREGHEVRALRGQAQEQPLAVVQGLLAHQGASIPQYPSAGSLGREPGVQGGSVQVIDRVEGGRAGSRAAHGVGVHVRTAGGHRQLCGGLPAAGEHDRGGLRVLPPVAQPGPRPEEGAVPAGAWVLPDRSVVGFRASVVAEVHAGVAGPVYDIGVEDEHEFVADGFVVHNCWRESMGTKTHPGWLSPEMVIRKKAEVSERMFAVEYDLQEPSTEGRAIDTDHVERCFDEAMGAFEGMMDREACIEDPMERATYVTGVDWAKEQDFTVIRTFRTDVRPWREVCFMRTGRKPWPYMVALVEERMRRYGGLLVHDATGIGNVVDDLIDYDRNLVIPIVMRGRDRETMFSDYVAAIEHDEIACPRVEFTYKEHLYCTYDDLFGKGHPPDSVVSGSLAWAARKRMQGTPTPFYEDFIREAPFRM